MMRAADWGGHNFLMENPFWKMDDPIPEILVSSTVS
jgi:hypothetical protein